MSYFKAIQLENELGVPYGVKHVNNKPRVSAMPYLYDIAEGNVTDHTPWTKIGFNPALTAEEDIWSAGGSYVFPTGATAMAVIGGATDDGSPAIYSGTASAGTSTSLTDTAKNFTTGAIVGVGDCVILEKAGTTPEWGYVTALVGTDTLTIGGGFSSGGNPNGRTYDVIDKALSVGAQAVKIDYLDTTYATKTEIVILNGAAEVNLTGQPFRINSFRVIATGSSNTSSSTGLTLKAQTPTATIYSFITGLFTRARNSVYTVPIGKTLYVTQFSAAYGTTGSPNREYARIYTRANREQATGFLTGSLFYPYTEIMAQNNTAVIHIDCPTKLIAKTDIKISAVATAAGAVSTVLRGWLE